MPFFFFPKILQDFSFYDNNSRTTSSELRSHSETRLRRGRNWRRSREKKICRSRSRSRSHEKKFSEVGVGFRSRFFRSCSSLMTRHKSDLLIVYSLFLVNISTFSLCLIFHLLLSYCIKFHLKTFRMY
jgi:hypothetical protein